MEKMSSCSLQLQMLFPENARAGRVAPVDLLTDRKPPHIVGNASALFARAGT